MTKHIEMILAERCRISAYDPAATENARRLFADEAIAFASDPYEAMQDADALVVLTD